MQRLRTMQWGQWRLKPSNHTLMLYDPTPQYEIDLDTITDSAHMLDWIFQIQTKSWATSSMVGDLVAAFQDLFDPQAKLCSFGRNKTIDPVKHLDDLLPETESTPDSTGQLIEPVLVSLAESKIVVCDACGKSFEDLSEGIAVWPIDDNWHATGLFYSHKGSCDRILQERHESKTLWDQLDHFLPNIRNERRERRANTKVI